jgi:DNA invertase Pin-like site-specific DNA recombinase
MRNLPLIPGQLKITPAHLQRQAVVYVRQSSLKQVRENLESQRNQRALVERAESLGWHVERVRVFDGDLGRSAAQAGERGDFQALAAEVALGHVGLILGWEVSRLARNNADWYRLLDLAALFGTLIADIEGIYDPRVYNDRLLLGLKGTMSEAELHMLRQRLTAGRLSQVARGEYVQHLPTGLVRLGDGSVVKDPDAQVRQILELLFNRFEALGSCQKLLRFLKQQGILLPRRPTAGLHRGELLWKKPAAAALYETLTNPAYAGAFVYGRRPRDPQRAAPGRPSTGFVRKPIAEWPYVHHGAYPAYLTWEAYLANQATMHDNALQHAQRTRPGRGAPRAGTALLQGLATCGMCGHRMKVAYKRGTRYVCDGLAQEFAERQCASLEGVSIDTIVVQAFFEAIQPAQLDALEALLVRQRQEHAELERYWAQQVQRATYEAHLARRRYEAVDPENRLVAAELERRWEATLVGLRQSEEAAKHAQQEQPVLRLDPELRQQLEHLSQTLPGWWEDGRLTWEQKKRLLRSLIARVILKRTAPDRVEVKIVWVSGHFTVLAVQPAIWRECDVTGYDRLVERVHALWAEGFTDGAIAEQLTQEGFHSARSPEVRSLTVQKIRLRAQWYQPLHQSRGADSLGGYLTAAGLAKRLGIERTWVYRRLEHGEIDARHYTRHPQSGVYLIADDAELIAHLRKEVNGRLDSHRGI